MSPSLILSAKQLSLLLSFSHQSFIYNHLQSTLSLIMKYTTLFAAAAAAFANSVNAGVFGAAQGFAKGVTGGGNAAEAYPKTNDELVSYLGGSEPRVIVLDRTYVIFLVEATGPMKHITDTTVLDIVSISLEPRAQRPPAVVLPGERAQNARLPLTCTVGVITTSPTLPRSPPLPSMSIGYIILETCNALTSCFSDQAGILGIVVNSNKSLVGKGSAGAIKGKGIRMVSGAKNNIVQNIAITDLNPQYVRGGDAITLNNADLVWIDHVTTARIDRQHIALGTKADNRVTISYSLIDGRSDWSATCNGHHYWGLYLDGSNDMVTLIGNYFYNLSGRMPKVQGNTLLHAVRIAPSRISLLHPQRFRPANKKNIRSIISSTTSTATPLRLARAATSSPRVTSSRRLAPSSNLLCKAACLARLMSTLTRSARPTSVAPASSTLSVAPAP